MPSAPTVPRKKGSPRQKEQAKAEFLKAVQLDPKRSNAKILAELGYGSNGTLSYWRQSDPAWWQSVEIAKAALNAGSARPPVPDFRTFRERYLNVEEENPITLRRDLVGVTYPYMENFVAALDDDSERFLCCLWPVRHAKTKIIEQFVVWWLCRNPNATIGIVCGSADLAKDRLYVIETMLEDTRVYADLHANWGPWIGKPQGSDKSWTKGQFIVAGRTGSARDPSVRGFGAKKKILGARLDLIILDDVDDPSHGPADRATILRNINTAIRTRLNEGGKIVAIGTRCGPSDIYSVLLQRDKWWTEVLSAYDENGDPLCAQMYSAEELEEIRADMSEGEFALMLLNEPGDEYSTLFPPDLVTACRGDYGLGRAALPGDQPGQWEVISSLDPAPNGRSALATIAHNLLSGEIRVIDCVTRTAAGYEGTFEMMSYAVRMHKPSRFVVEEQGGSSPPFAQYPAVSAFLLTENCRYERFTTGRNKNDPREGIALVRDLMVTKRLSFAYGTHEAERKMRVLEEEMKAFQPNQVFSNRRRFDCLMALWFACSVVHKGRIKQPVLKVPDYLARRRPWVGGRWQTAKRISPAATRARESIGA